MRSEKNRRDLLASSGAFTSILSATPSVLGRLGGWDNEPAAVSGPAQDRRHFRPGSGRFAHHRRARLVQACRPEHAIATMSRSTAADCFRPLRPGRRLSAA